MSQWGDHLATADGSAAGANLPLSIATAFYYLDVTTMAKIADVLGNADDAKAYRELAGEIKKAFNDRFYDDNVGYYDSGVQSAQAWALVFGLTEEANHERVEKYLIGNVHQRQRRLTTGYCGTKYAIEALAAAGRNDIVWWLANATTYPSWGYMLRGGKTTSVERWDGEKGSMNHAPLGAAIDEWFYWGLAGIRPTVDGPGYESIVFKPYVPPDLEWARASLQTARGVVASEWRRDGEAVLLEVTVPGNSAATVHVPAPDAAQIAEGDAAAAEAEGVTLLQSSEGETVFEVGSGTYRFRFPVG
jgi:alpha-L-rhamnosidase